MNKQLTFHQALLSRRRFLMTSGLAAAAATLSACTTIQAPLPIEAAVKSPDEALERLMAGNQRFVANRELPINESAARRTEVAGGQNPFAIIFSCVDSRVPPELVFDRGLGDLFVIRTAGHVIDQAVLGSLEFGVAELKIPLLLVMGHEKCGAVKATIEAIEQGSEAPSHIEYLVDALRPAIEKGHEIMGDDTLDNCVKVNTQLTLPNLLKSPILSAAVEAGNLKIVGGHYELATGSVSILES